MFAQKNPLLSLCLSLSQWEWCKSALFPHQWNKLVNCTDLNQLLQKSRRDDQLHITLPYRDQFRIYFLPKKGLTLLLSERQKTLGLGSWSCLNFVLTERWNFRSEVVIKTCFPSVTWDFDAQIAFTDAAVGNDTFYNKLPKKPLYVLFLSSISSSDLFLYYFDNAILMLPSLRMWSSRS